MKVLITGATGLVGSEIVKQCEEEGVEVHYLTRNKSKITTDKKHKGFYWNPNNGEIDETCLSGVDKIINLAGASIAQRWTQKNKRKILNSRIDSLQTLFNLLEKKDHQITQLISASAIGVYPSSLQKLYDEDSQEIADNFLGEVVSKWEKQANKFSDLGIDVTKIRIGIVLSEKGGALPKLTKPIKNYIGSPLGSGKQWQSWIHIEDLAGIFLHTLQNDLEGTYNAVAANPVSNEKMTKIIAEKLERPLFLPNVPSFILKILLGKMSKIVLDSQLVSNKKIETTGFMFRFTHVNLALENLL
ncbi:TIGR01777 family oxidoreductase [Mesonia aquimarina]|uniref:TIGR01777 family oxidoreductase n=1 Tax=Mesonia aquimarina TaxID=1504967 RepID=UPI000EF60808|nr:TIGR01777 family oxidoreductase [Mesonia aquimarina]